MGLETGEYINDLQPSNPAGWPDEKREGDDHMRLIKKTLKQTLPGLAGRVFRVVAKTSAYTVQPTDNTVTLSCTGTWSLGFVAAASLGNGFMCFVCNTGTGTITLSPYTGEQVNGAASAQVLPGQVVLLQSTGTSLVAHYIGSGGLLDAGTASGVDTYTAELQYPLKGLAAGTLIAVTFTSANTTTTPTLDVSGIGAKNIVGSSGESLRAGSIADGLCGLLLYNGTSFYLLNPALSFLDRELGTPTMTTQPVDDNSAKGATTKHVWRSNWGPYPIMGTKLFGATNLPQNATRFLGEPGSSADATASNRIIVVTKHVIVRDLLVWANALMPAGQTATFTWMKNGVATSLSAQCTSSDQMPANTTDYFEAGPGDYLTLRAVLSASTGSTTDFTVSTRFIDPASGEGVSWFPFKTATSVLGQVVTPGVGMASPTGTYNHYPIAVPNVVLDTSLFLAIAGIKIDLRYAGSSVLGLTTSTDLDFTALSFPAAVYSSIPVPLPQGGVFLYTNPADADIAGAFSMKRRYAGGESPYMPIFLSSVAQAQGTTLYMRGHGATGVAAESEAQYRLTAGKLRDFIFYNSGGGVSGQSWTAVVRKNGAAVLTLTIDGLDVVNIDNTTEIAVTADDLISVSSTSSASTGTRTVHFAFNHVPV